MPGAGDIARATEPWPLFIALRYAWAEYLHFGGLMVLTLTISYGVYEAYEKRFNALRDRYFPATVSGVRATVRTGHA